MRLTDDHGRSFHNPEGGRPVTRDGRLVWFGPVERHHTHEFFLDGVNLGRVTLECAMAAYASASPPAASMPKQFGMLARTCGHEYELQVLSSRAGHYIGTADPDGLPCSRESVEYFPDQASALAALDSGGWTQRSEPGDFTSQSDPVFSPSVRQRG